MPNRATILTALATLGLLACGGDKSRTDVALDTSTFRDSLTPIVDAPRQDSVTLPPPAAPAPATTPPRATPKPKPTPRPTTTAPAAPPATVPAPARAPTLVTGTTVAATAIDSIHSHLNKAGDVVRVKVATDVADSNGKVVIPAGAVVKLHVVQIGEAQNRGEKGTLVLSADEVEINGTSYPVTARASDYTYEMKARPVGAGEVAKTGAGAAAGAIVGRIIGGKTGTVVGAVGGGAAGAAIAAKSANRDIIVHAGNSVTLTLRDDFVRKP
jgi:uncharacterized protein YcfJ